MLVCSIARRAGLSLTESGQAFYERSVALLSDLAEAESIVGQAAVTPRGTLRLTCSYNMAEKRVAPAISAFVERYPDVKFDVVVSDRLIDWIDEGFDLAIRVGQVGSDRLVARRAAGALPIRPDNNTTCA